MLIGETYSVFLVFITRIHYLFDDCPSFSLFASLASRKQDKKTIQTGDDIYPKPYIFTISNYVESKPTINHVTQTYFLIH